MFLELDGWSRRAHFELFRGYDNPWFNVCAPIDVTALFEACSASDGPSFFLASLFCSLGAANEVEAFRLRIRGDRVWRHARIHGGSTVLRDDETFGFGYFDFTDDFDAFQSLGLEELDRVRSSHTLEPADDRDDLIHYSVLPWIRFTSFSHARRWGVEDSVPKIVFGRHHRDGSRRLMPVSVEVHHALADGLHVARFLEAFQERLRAPSL